MVGSFVVCESFVKCQRSANHPGLRLAVATERQSGTKTLAERGGAMLHAAGIFGKIVITYEGSGPYDDKLYLFCD